LKEPLFQESHPALKIIFFGVLWIFAIILLGGLTLAFYDDSIESTKLLTALQHILLFVLPPIFAAYLFSENIRSYLYLKNVKPALYILSFLIIFFSMPLVNYTGFLNSKMVFPESFSWLETILLEMEESAKQMTEDFLTVDTTKGLLINLLIIAVLPAIGEELLFRGILIRLLNEWFKNIHITIFITAFLFSFIHLQFYGFLPRMLLGVIFGYMLYWSGSIWLPMLTHFLNNATAVIIWYLYHDTKLFEKADSFGSAPSDLIWMLLSTAFMLLFFILLRISSKEEAVQIN
jgi:membrane protease YdiL (CAAX protease family)